MKKKRTPTIEKINQLRLAVGSATLTQEEIDAFKAQGIKSKEKVVHPPKAVNFCSWDGEGVTLQGRHKYILLMNSLDKSLVDKKGIPTEDVLWWMTEVSRLYPGYTHISFAFSYDVNMIIKDLIHYEGVLERLHDTNKVYWKNYSIEYVPRKYFTITRYPEDMLILKNGHKRKPEASITIWDTFGFFGCSFLQALDTFFNEDEKQNLHYQQIKVGKDDRSDFSDKDLQDFIIPYCALELVALNALMDRMYNKYCIGAGIGLDRFDGSGAIAASILKKTGVKQYFGKVENPVYSTDGNALPSTKTGVPGYIPYQVGIAAQYAYSGGHIELFRYGHFTGKIYHKDICSAYPSEMVKLPNYSNGLWIHVKSPTTIHPYSLYKIRWKYPSGTDTPFYPFFYRSDNGGISYPSEGIGWYHTPEIEAALKWNDVLKGHIELLEEWTFIPGDDIKPFGFVQEMYNTRRDLKRTGNGMNVVYKLGYNSFYGKMIQHVGYEQKEREGKTNWRPPYFQLQYGGLITSGVRAKMFNACMQKPHSIIAMATDGIWSTEDLNVQENDDLGNWESEVQDSCTFVQAGVYWTHRITHKMQKVACPEHGQYCEMIQHYRGFDKKNLTEDRVLDAWEQGETKLGVECTRFVTLGGALVSEKRLKEKWHEWIKSIRWLELYPTGIHGKRSKLEDSNALHPHKGLIATIPNDTHIRYNGRTPLISDIYPLPWTEAWKEYKEQKKTTDEKYQLYDDLEEQSA